MMDIMTSLPYRSSQTINVALPGAVVAFALISAMSTACGRVSYDPLAADTDDGAPPSDDAQQVQDAAQGDDAASGCDLPPGLVMHLPFDEESGNLASDASGNGHDGALVGLDDTHWVAGHEGGALDLTNTEGYVNSGSDARVDDLSTMTLCAWIYPTSYPNDYPAIADKSEDTFTGGWNFYIETGGLLGFLTNRRKWASGGAIALNAWQHVCSSWDGSNGTNGIALYIDGAGITTTDTGSNGANNDSDANRDVLIGRVNNGTYEFDGLIDDLQLYGRVLDSAEIMTIFGGCK